MISGRVGGALLATSLMVATVFATAPTAAVAAPLEGLPNYRHVIVLVEENESLAATYGPGSQAVYLRSLAAQYTLADHYYAIGHISLDNYIAMISGIPDQPLTGLDCMGVSLYTCAAVQSAFSGGRNLGDQYDAAGVTWKGYMDGNTAPCQHGNYMAGDLSPDPYQGNGATPAAAGKDYADRHNPFIYFPDIVGDPARCQAHVRPYTELAGDLAHNTLPQFVFITPDTCHDGHDNPCSGGGTGGLTSANTWLAANGPALVNYVNTHQSLLLITTDESANSDTSGCCAGGAGGALPGIGGLIGLVAVGPGVKAGQAVHTPYDHMALFRTLESVFGVSERLNNAAQSSAMSDLFQAGFTFPPASPSAGGGGSLPTTTLPNSSAAGTHPASALSWLWVAPLALLVLAVTSLWLVRRRG